MSKTVPRTAAKLKQKPQDHSGSEGLPAPIGEPIARRIDRTWPDPIHEAYLSLKSSRGPYDSNRLLRDMARQAVRYQ